MTQQGTELLKATLNSLKAIDSTLSETQISQILRIYQSEESKERNPDFCISREDAARIIGRDERTVDYYCRKGDFRRIRIGKAARACGISALSVAQATGMTMDNLMSALTALKPNKRKAA